LSTVPLTLKTADMTPDQRLVQLYMISKNGLFRFYTKVFNYHNGHPPAAPGPQEEPEQAARRSHQVTL